MELKVIISPKGSDNSSIYPLMLGNSSKTSSPKCWFNGDLPCYKVLKKTSQANPSSMWLFSNWKCGSSYLSSMITRQSSHSHEASNSEKVAFRLKQQDVFFVVSLNKPTMFNIAQFRHRNFWERVKFSRAAIPHPLRHASKMYPGI